MILNMHFSNSLACIAEAERSPAAGQQISLGKDEKAGMKILAHALVGLAATLDCSLETFSLGAAARACGTIPLPTKFTLTLNFSVRSSVST
jgi:hypothetical protein